ncbi:MAG: pyridoxine 5'-phosphate synthase [Gammaproteobacteria bacterium]|nr:pyridoxine 5'-phosphate synthase [Gammaproteobacteria bacterium]
MLQGKNKLESIRLGVNIDHVATIRQARFTQYPDPVAAALIAEQAGADYITLHLREDRRHIQPHDVERLMVQTQTAVNLEMAITEDMLAYAERIQPRDVCLVPEKRQELTTEGGLDVAGQLVLVKNACTRLAAAGIRVSLFIDADVRQLEAVLKTGAPMIELHTGHYAALPKNSERDQLLTHISIIAEQASAQGLQVNAGHGLHYENVSEIAALSMIADLNIGHAIVGQSMLVGMSEAVRSMKQLMLAARH